jgi:hypothetical protein
VKLESKGKFHFDSLTVIKDFYNDNSNNPMQNHSLEQ